MAESDAAPLRRVTTTADEATPIHCPYCATQRGSALADGPGEIATVNAVLSSPAQLTTPLRRAHLGAPLEPCTWEEALDTIAAEIMKLRAAHGPDAVAVFGGNGLGREELRSRTSQADGNGRFCTSSAAAALNRAFGRDRGLPGPLTDVSAADVIFMVGGNPAGTMPPFAQHLADQRAAGGARIVADPRRTTAARQSDLHLQLTPGTDLALANGMLHLAVTEGLLDEAYIRARTSGFDAVRTKVGAYWPERVERITGVPLPKIREAVRMLAAGQRSLILTAHGDGQQARGADTVTAFINLALGLGLPGTAGSGYGCVTGHGRRGRLPGHRGVADPAVCEHLASVWGVHPEVLPGPGRSAYELLRAFGTGGGPRALLLFGSDPVVSAPRAAEVEERLNTLDLLVVADRVLSETAQRADVVLPTAQRAGESGGRTDLEILAGLGSRLGTPGPWTTAGDRTEQESGLFWPCPQTADQHPGTARPFLAGFATPDGRARFTPVGHRGPDEDTDSEYPIHLTTGEVPAHDQGGAPSRHAVLEQFVELNPDLAERLGVLDGEPVRITSRQGISVARARVTDTIRADSVFMPFHRADAARDPIAWMPESLVCAVRVEPGTHGDREAP